MNIEQQAIEAGEGSDPHAIWSLISFWKHQGTSPLAFESALCLFSLVANCGTVKDDGQNEAMIMFWSFVFCEGIHILKDGPLPLSADELKNEFPSAVDNGDREPIKHLTVVAGPSILGSDSPYAALELMKKEASK